MPYIEVTARPSLDDHLRTTAAVGELNYASTHLILKFIREQGGLSYTTANAAIGALECAKLELYRRLVVPYEDNKVAEKGDVYPE
jgi:hypothetical protein